MDYFTLTWLEPIHERRDAAQIGLVAKEDQFLVDELALIDVAPCSVNEGIFIIEIGQPRLAFISLLLVEGKYDICIITFTSLSKLNFVFSKVSKVLFGFSR